MVCSAAKLLLLTEEGIVQLVDCAPSDAAMAHQIERFQQRLERAPKRGWQSSLPPTSLCSANTSRVLCVMCVPCAVCRVPCGTGIGTLEGPQVRDDCTLFLVDLLRKAKLGIVELEKSLQLASTNNNNKGALAAACRSLGLIAAQGNALIRPLTVAVVRVDQITLTETMVYVAIETADGALAYINNQVTLNTVHNLYRFSLPFICTFLWPQPHLSVNVSI